MAATNGTAPPRARRLVETFNTHLMTDEVIAALATGRDREVAQITKAIRQAVADPAASPPALIVYGERGSGKSFLMRLVQMECAEIPGLACVLLPEEQYNIRQPQQLLQAVTAQIDGRDWSDTIWQFDPREPEAAWREEVAALGEALDRRFGDGQGLAVVMVENFDLLVDKLFGATPGSKAATARRQAEERLRKLMNARNTRFMLIASATGTVDMDYDQPLFHAFTAVDLDHWDADTAIAYYQKRRQLENLPPLGAAETARARAVTEFIGGNPRLAQLLGEALSQPEPQGIAGILDELVDHLADYYRNRLDALPPAAAGALDALIRGGEPASQSGLAQRMNAQQSQIADAFSFLTRSRLVQATRERGGAATLYHVRDRLFVHFYRRRYGQVSSLVAVAELLERFFTPEERQDHIRAHLSRGEFAEASAFGRLPLDGGGRERGYCWFRDSGISDGPAHEYFTLAGETDPAQIGAQRELICHEPRRAYREWSDRARSSAVPVIKAACQALAAIAASRAGLDGIAKRDLDDAVTTESLTEFDARIVILDAASEFYWSRVRDEYRALTLLTEMESLVDRATSSLLRAIAFHRTSFWFWHHERYPEADLFARRGLEQEPPPRLRAALLTYHGLSLKAQAASDDALAVLENVVSLARRERETGREAAALKDCAKVLHMLGRYEEAISMADEAATAAANLDDVDSHTSALFDKGVSQMELGDLDTALATVREGLALARDAQPPAYRQVAAGSCLVAAILLDQDEDNDQGRTSAARAAGVAAKINLEYANAEGNIAWAVLCLNAWLLAASLAPMSDALDALDRLLQLNALDRLSQREVEQEMKRNTLDRWLTAVARADAWAQATALIHRHPILLQTDFPGIAQSILGERLAATAAQTGRVAAYGLAAAAIPVIAAFLTAGRAVATPSPAIWSDLVARPADPGLLRDIAELLREHFRPLAEPVASQFEFFAAFHEAPDKEAFLQRVDPDFATFMRQILDLPPPPDASARRGRKRAR